MALDIKQSTATAILLGPFLDDSDGKTAEDSLTVANIDVDVYKFSDSHALTKVDITPAASGTAHDMAHVANGYWSLELTATDTNTLGRMIVTANISGALPVWQEFNVLDGTKYDEKYSSTTPTVDVVKVSGDATAANNLELMYDGTGYAGGTAKLGVDVVKVSGDSGAADNLESMYDGTGYVGGTAKLTVDVAKVSGDSTAADNMELMFDGTGYAGGTAKLGVDVVAISGDTAAANNMESYYDGTGYGIQASSASTVVTVGALNSAAIDDVWETDTLTETYASDGAIAKPSQLLYMILCAVSEFSISSTTVTGKKLDGSTTAMTWTLNDATSPTSRTRVANP